MWISSEDARSDFILAAAAVFLGVQVVSLLSSIPGYPRSGTPFLVLSLVWMVLLACAAPWLLARYRNDVPGAFGLQQGDRGRLTLGLLLAAPLVVGDVLPTALTGDVPAMLLALGGRLTLFSPTIADFRIDLQVLVIIASVLVLAIGSALTGAFLAVRARDAFRSPDMDLTELLRTFGLGAVGLALVMGMLAAIRDDGSMLTVLTRAVALLVIVLVADQYVPARMTVTRASVVGPAVAVLVLWVIAYGGPFRGDLLLGLASGTAAAAIMVAAAALLHARQGLAAAILLAASAIWPVGSQAIQPLPLTILLG